MRRVLGILYVGLLAAGLVWSTGCKENIPLSELEKFSVSLESLPEAALQDTLRTFMRGGDPLAKYAAYMMGNRFYAAANDSAMEHGWASPGAVALMDSAEVYFNAAVERDSTFLEALVNLGSLWDDRTQSVASREEFEYRVAQAEGFYRKALNLDPTDEKARCNLGSLYLRMRRTGEALDEFKTALAHDPESPLAHYNLAIMFAEAKIYREAIVEFDLAAKCDPGGDIGERARENSKIVKDLMSVPTPDSVK